MRTYARIENGVVQEIVLPYVNEAGEEVNLEFRFPPYFVEQSVDITDIVPQPDQQWTYDGSVFLPPPPPIVDVVAVNEATKASLLSLASQVMAPILVSLQLGDATNDEMIAARQWQAYYRSLKSVDITVPNPDWPVSPDDI
ncbi:tail fiber assembly protein [Pseudomonas fluorescens]|uniref:tail fiber assembly protein n=1 Tax=Pseudomonas fluorescens TaxID=294 RepID=UPI0030DD5DD5